MSLEVRHEPEANPDIRVPDPHQDAFSKTVLGFWVYLMSDCLLFGTLFATYAVLHLNTFGGPSARELFSLPLAFAETMILLASSVTCGLALLAAKHSSRSQGREKVVGWLVVTALLGAAFLSLELHEFATFVHEGNSWTRSGFLSAFFTLVGTHGLHISVGLLWVLVMIGQVAAQGITVDSFRRLVVFGLFWHFLDLIWIFIFTFVYLLGVL